MESRPGVSWVNRACHGEAEKMLAELAERPTSMPPDERDAVVASLQLARGDFAAALAAAERARTWAEHDGGPGWRAFTLALRAAARMRVSRMADSPPTTEPDPSLLLDFDAEPDRPGGVVVDGFDDTVSVGVLDGLADLAEAEVILGLSASDEMAATASTEVGHVYRALRLHEMALPNLERSLTLRPQPSPVTAMDLVLLHLDWADELDRVDRVEECRAHVRAAHGWWQRVVSQPDRDGSAESRIRSRYRTELLGAIIEARLDPDRGLAALVRWSRAETHPVDRIVSLCGLARALRDLGRPVEATVAAQRAVDLGALRSLPRTVANRAGFELHRAQLAAGLPGSAGIARLFTIYHEDLWAQRTNALNGVRARRALAALRVRLVETDRLALLDPLTEVGNRRALTDWLERHPHGPVTLLMVDIDHFKSVNDRFGHAMGDLVLRRLADSLGRSLAGPLDHDGLLARYGGDEFAVLTASEASGLTLPTLIAAAADGVSTSDLSSELDIRLTVGVARAPAGTVTGDLVERADRAMLAAKRARSSGGRPVSRARR